MFLALKKASKKTKEILLHKLKKKFKNSPKMKSINHENLSNIKAIVIIFRKKIISELVTKFLVNDTYSQSLKENDCWNFEWHIKDYQKNLPKLKIICLKSHSFLSFLIFLLV